MNSGTDVRGDEELHNMINLLQSFFKFESKCSSLFPTEQSWTLWGFKHSKPVYLFFSSVPPEIFALSTFFSGSRFPFYSWQLSKG